MRNVFIKAEKKHNGEMCFRVKNEAERGNFQILSTEVTL